MGRQRLTLAARRLPPAAKFLVGKFIGQGSGAFDDVGDAKFEAEKERTFNR